MAKQKQKENKKRKINNKQVKNIEQLDENKYIRYKRQKQQIIIKNNRDKNQSNNIFNKIFSKINIFKLKNIENLAKRKALKKQNINNAKSEEEIQEIIKTEIIRKEKYVFIFFVLLISILTFLTITLQIKTINKTNVKEIGLMRDAEIRSGITDVKTKNEEYRQKIIQQQNKIEAYKNSIKGEKNAPELLEEELKQTRKHLGYTDVKGQGIIITLQDDEKNGIKITESDLLMLINQLWISGAEAISINDERIAYNTEITLVNGKIIHINGKAQNGTYLIKAIGNSKHLESAIILKDGYINQLLGSIKKINYRISENVEIKKQNVDKKTNYTSSN